MLEGTPYEIGFQHGSKLKDRIGDCIEEYKKLFQVYAQMEWDTCVDLARSYKPILMKLLKYIRHVVLLWIQQKVRC